MRLTRNEPSAPSTEYERASLEILLLAVFSSWNDNGIEFVILRNYQGLPAFTGNDVDVLVRPDQIKTAEALMVRAAGRAGYLPHNRVEFATLSCFFYHPETLRQIQIDLFDSLKWHAFEFLSAAEVVKRRVRKGLFSIPSPADEGIISLLTRLIYRGHVRDSYKEGILRQLRVDPQLAEDLLEQTFGRSLASELIHAALEEKWDGVVGLQGRLRRNLVLRSLAYHPVRTVRSLTSDGARLLRRFRRPGGIVVAVLGADGSGKSTVAREAIEQLKSTFNPGKMLEVHWKPVVFFRKRRAPSGKPNVNPHGRPPRNKAASFFYLWVHWLEFFIGSHVHFRRTVFKNGFVLVDRYYYDFLVDQRRYRLDVPNRLVRLIFRFVREPDIVFLFDAPAEVLQSRKQEVPPAETARQVTAYRELVSRLPQGQILDASKPIESVASRFVERVLQHLKDRLERH